MYRHSWNKVIVSSFALGAAGILTCISALLSVLVPTWSVLAFIAVLVPLGVAIVGVLAGFVWLCDKYEEYIDRKKNNLLGEKGEESGGEINPGDRRFRSNADRSRFSFPSSHLLSGQYISTLRGSAPPKPNPFGITPAMKSWHCQ